MLILSRRVGENIVINNNIKIHFLSYKKTGKFRVGIEAPENVKVNLGEVLDEISSSKKTRQENAN